MGAAEDRPTASAERRRSVSAVLKPGDVVYVVAARAETGG